MKQDVLIRSLVVALPAGLLVLGVGAMLFTHMNPRERNHDPNEEVRLEAASLNRRPVSQADLERNLDILANQIGERHVGKPDELEKAAVWIESTMGGANLGYQVERHV